MPPSKKGSKSKKAAAPVKSTSKPKENPLFPSTKRNFGVGGDILPKKTEVSRFVRWPKYIRMQRQKKILMQRLKTPPALNQFNNTINKNEATELFKLLMKMQPETKAEKTVRIKSMAESKAAGGDGTAPAPRPVVKFGLKHVTTLVEKKKAKLVIIAHDVNPIELVVWLPALCKRMDVPYCIVKGKARLGAVVHKKNSAVLAVVNTDKEDSGKLTQLSKAFYAQYNEGDKPRWGDNVMGLKTQKKLEIRAKQKAIEEAKKAQY